MACIGIDCRFGSVAAGLGTYTRNVVPALVHELKGHHIVLFVRDTSEAWLESVPDSVTLCVFPATHYSVKEQLLLPRRLKQFSVDLFYTPHFTVPLRCPVPFVCTVHDLTLHHYPNSAGFLKRFGYKVVMRHAVKQAKEVIAVSEYTTKDIALQYGRQARHVTEGVSPGYKRLSKPDTAAVLTDYGLMGQYFLYVGGTNEHKNLQLLLDAHAQSEVDVPLVLVSNGKHLSSLKLHDGVVILPSVPDHDLPALYNGALAFVTASLYEGFCLPILDARACGTPVIATNVTAIPEVAGSHALLVEPTLDALAAALKAPPTKSDAPEAKYSWQKSARQIADILTSQLHG